MRPMLAVPADVPGALPRGADWAYEVKWDGMRVLADARAGSLRLLSRSGRDVTAAFPELGVLTALPDALLDGEVVALDAAGRPSFAALTERMHVADPRRAAALVATTPVSYMVFDVLRLYGVDVTARTFDERRATLERLVLPAPAVQLSPLYDDGDDLLAATAEQELEGVVAKRRSAPYAVGRRSPAWVKAAHRLSRTVLVGGWRPEVGSTTTVGALLVGAPGAGGGLHYLGRVGSGIAGAVQADLARVLSALASPSSPFADEVPRVDATGATWTLPTLAVEVRYLGITPGRRLRAPSFHGVRTDTGADPLD